MTKDSALDKLNTGKVVSFLEAATQFANDAINTLNLLPQSELDTSYFVEKARDIIDLANCFADTHRVSGIPSYFILSRCVYLMEELHDELDIIQGAVGVKILKSVKTPLDPRKIIQYRKERNNVVYPVDFKSVYEDIKESEGLSYNSVRKSLLTAIDEFHTSIDYDSMPEAMKKEAHTLLDGLLMEPLDKQLLIVKSVLCITVED